MKLFSGLVVPLILCLVGTIMMLSKRDMMTVFINGATEGMKSCIELLPTFILLICAVKMFNTSGASQIIAGLMSPMLSLIGIPSELTPLLVVRPISGGASNAVIESIFTQYGTDSFIGRCASVIAGSSDTVIYITALYFGSVEVTKTRYTLIVSLTVTFFCTLLSCILCRIIFN